MSPAATHEALATHASPACDRFLEFKRGELLRVAAQTGDVGLTRRPLADFVVFYLETTPLLVVRDASEGDLTVRDVVARYYEMDGGPFCRECFSSPDVALDAVRVEDTVFDSERGLLPGWTLDTPICDGMVLRIGPGRGEVPPHAH